LRERYVSHSFVPESNTVTKGGNISPPFLPLRRLGGRTSSTISMKVGRRNRLTASSHLLIPTSRRIGRCRTPPKPLIYPLLFFPPQLPLCFPFNPLFIRPVSILLADKAVALILIHYPSRTEPPLSAPTGPFPLFSRTSRTFFALAHLKPDVPDSATAKIDCPSFPSPEIFSLASLRPSPVINLLSFGQLWSQAFFPIVLFFSSILRG